MILILYKYFDPKILIVTQSGRPSKHEGYDRTGDYTTRTKITQELVHHIEDGLRYYEQDLWNDNEWAQPTNTSSSFKVINYSVNNFLFDFFINSIACFLF